MPLPQSDVEQYFKVNNLVFIDDVDTFERLCDNVRSGIRIFTNKGR